LDSSAAAKFVPYVHSNISLSSQASLESDFDRDRGGGGSGSKGAAEADMLLGRTAAATANVSASTMTIKLSCATCAEYSLGTNYCSNCSAFSIRCGICQEGIRGAAIYCPACLHGGHGHHIAQWFGQMGEAYCPTGCGCECSVHLKPSEQTADPADGNSDDSLSDTSGPSRVMGHHSSYSESSGGESGSGESSSEEEEEYRRSATSKLFQKR
jgi:hypothetical protein